MNIDWTLVGLLCGVAGIYLYGEWYWRFGAGKHKARPARKPRRKI